MRKILMMTVSVLAADIGLSQAAHAGTAPPAQDQDMTEVTIIATKSEKKVADAPATVSVITARQIDDQLVTDIKDLVRFEPGVAVTSSPARFTAAGASTGRDGNASFNIRGIEGNRVLMQIDGIRVPDAFSFGAQAAGRGGYADLDLIKSVEILRGPASALYGSDGVAGAVSFTTKDPQDFLKAGKSFGGQLKAGYAEADDSWAKGLVLAGQSGRWSSMLAYSRRDGHEQETHGSATFPDIRRTAADPQDITSNAALAKLVYTPSDGQRLRLTLDHYDNVTDTNVLSAIAAPPAPPAVLSSTAVIGLKAHDTTHRDRASLDYRYRGTGVIDGVDAVIYTQSAKNGQYAWEDRNTAADRTRINLFNTKVSGLNIDLTSHLTTGSVSHTFTYGGDLSVTRQESVRDGTVPPAGETFPTRAFPTTNYTRTGVFVQDEIKAGDLSLYPAVRYDSYDLKPKAETLTTFTPEGQHGDHVSPKIGLVYKFTPEVGLFINAGEGYKAPAPGEVNNAFTNLIQGYKSIPNPDLKPEISETLEGGLRYAGDAVSASFAVYSGRYRDFISQEMVGGTFAPNDPGIFQFINLDKVKLSGVEARGSFKFGNGFALNAAASSTTGKVTDLTGTHDLDSVQPWKAVAGISYHGEGDRFGGAFTVTHSAKKEHGAGFVPPAFTVADLTAYWNLTPSLALRAGIFNLTDEKYIWWSDVRGMSTTTPDGVDVSDAYTQPGRNASVSLAYRF